MRLCATFIFALVLVLPPWGGHGRAADTQPTQYQLKAAYLYHFAQFTDWPPTAFSAADSPLVIGVLGDNPFGANLEHTIQGKVLNDHPLTFQKFGSVAELTNSCHILFICTSERKHLPEIFAKLKGTSVLTVGEFEESDHFNENGGMINFVLDKNKIRFQINATTAEKANLKISFKLLSLASQVTH